MFCQNAFCYHLLRRVAQTTDFLAEMIETDFNRSLTSIDV